MHSCRIKWQQWRRNKTLLVFNNNTDNNLYSCPSVYPNNSSQMDSDIVWRFWSRKHICICTYNKKRTVASSHYWFSWAVSYISPTSSSLPSRWRSWKRYFSILPKILEEMVKYLPICRVYTMNKAYNIDFWGFSCSNHHSNLMCTRRRRWNEWAIFLLRPACLAIIGHTPPEYNLLSNYTCRLYRAQYEVRIFG